MNDANPAVVQDSITRRLLRVAVPLAFCVLIAAGFAGYAWLCLTDEPKPRDKYWEQAIARSIPAQSGMVSSGVASDLFDAMPEAFEPGTLGKRLSWDALLSEADTWDLASMNRFGRAVKLFKSAEFEDWYARVEQVTETGWHDVPRLEYGWYGADKQFLNDLLPVLRVYARHVWEAKRDHELAFRIWRTCFLASYWIE